MHFSSVFYLDENVLPALTTWFKHLIDWLRELSLSSTCLHVIRNVHFVYQISHYLLHVDCCHLLSVCKLVISFFFNIFLSIKFLVSNCSMILRKCWPLRVSNCSMIFRKCWPLRVSNCSMILRKCWPLRVSNCSMIFRKCAFKSQSLIQMLYDSVKMRLLTTRRNFSG